MKNRFYLLLVLCCAQPFRAPAQNPSQPVKPNFLLVYLDDQRWDAMQFLQKMQGEKARFPWLKTPNIDRLAAQSVWCRNTFATDSLCSPSRASILTGQYPHVHGVVNNHQPFPVNSVTYATLLQAAGYCTGFVGKWHMGTQRERPGFDYSASFLGQGEYYQCPFLVDGKEVPASDRWTDDVATDYAVGFLKAHREKPFALTVAFKAVHGPFQPDEPDRALYRDEKARPVPNLTAPASFQVPFQPKPFPAVMPNLVPYLECLAGADRDLGRLLDALDALGLAANTLVIFTSDNGFGFGEHELRGKRSAYEESMRIPLLVRAPFVPGAAGRAVDGIVLNVDFAPTLLDYAGLPVPKAMQGRSLRPLLEAEGGAGWRSAFLYEHFFERRSLWPTLVAVRTEDAKLIDYPNHPEWTEIFKLDKDPYETVNLSGKPEGKAIQPRLTLELAHLKDQTAYLVPGDSDKDTYVEDALEDVQWRKNFPDKPMSAHTHFASKDEKD